MSQQQAERFGDRRPGTGILLSAFLFLIAMAGVVWVYMGMITLDQWPIRWLEVDGAFARVSAEQVRSRIQPLVNDSYFTIDTHEVSMEVDDIAWVSRVEVQKTWPDTIQVRVYEHVPIAHWIGESLIDPEGVSFMVSGADEIQGLPWLEGPRESLDQVIESWQAFNTQLLPTGLEIEHIRLDRRGAWFLILNNGTEVQLGRSEARERLERMVASWPQLIRMQERAPIGVDLRYSNGLAVRWVQPPVLPANNRG